MHLSDRVTGAGLAGLGALAWVGAGRLPPMTGQPVGPSVFPMVIGAGLVLCGALVALGVGRTFEDGPDGAAEADAGQDGAAPPPRWQGLRALVPVAALVLYVLAVDRLGFVPTAAVMVLATAIALGAPLRWAAALAVLAPIVVHLIFARGLRVPLPAGWLPLPW